MDNKIFLEKVRSKESANTSSGLNVKLKGNRKLLPLNDVSDVISLMDQYTEEREKCNTIRLTCQVNPICSNILFNRISEIVKYEGSSGVTFLNYGISCGDDPFEGKEQVIYKPETLSFWSTGKMGYQSTDVSNTAGPSTRLDNDAYRTGITVDGRVNDNPNPHPTNAIRDTQLSRTDNDGDYFVYHCGLDILNNHLIRSKTFKTICKMPAVPEWETNGKPNSPSEDGYTAFNTIADLMRDAAGNKVIEKLYYPTTSDVDGGAKLTALHTYLYDDILTFNEAIKEKLIEKHNGWLGFLNRSKIKSYVNFKEDDPQDMRMERPLMYMNGGDYVDMYPGRDLYSFVPKYNKYRNRMEKNWNYCITYPSDSTIHGFEDIIEPTNDALKAVYFDENTRTDSGAMQLVIYSKAKHGLKEGDRVNIYKTNNGESELVLFAVEVDTVVDDFIFTTFTQGVQISKKWVELNEYDLMSGFTVSSDTSTETYTINLGDKFFYDSNFNRYYIINGKYVNIDPTAQNISYKKIVNGIESDYYVRIFSRLPNFRFSDGDTSTEYSIYNKPVVDNVEELSLLEKCQKPENEFESHLSRLAFARNAYSDEIGEIVFTDDINIANIHDNLGRPLTDIYLTIVKNNAGYKEWYGFDRLDCEISADTVEFSHCFGKITCGFEMSEESIDDTDAQNIRVINNVKGVNFGYDVSSINPRPADTNLTPHEIDFKTDIKFYGDLCCYDGYNAIEESIQPMMHRFNTAQRESVKAASGKCFSQFVYDEIYRDDYDTGDAFIIKQYQFDECNNKPEGYYYIPHYKIPVKTLGKLQSIMPTFLSIQSIINIIDLDAIQVTTQQYHFLKPGDKAIIYNMENDKYYYLTAIPAASSNDRVFSCKVYDEKGNLSHVINGDNIDNYRLFKVDNLGVPSYAHLLKDGTCRYIWRDIINNGSMGGDKNIEEYPFTNGAFYINKRIDLYLRRQDPYGTYRLFAEDDIDKFGVEVPFEQINYYKSEDEITC